MLLKSIWKLLRSTRALTLPIPGDLPSDPQEETGTVLSTTKSEIAELFQYELSKSGLQSQLSKTRSNL